MSSAATWALCPLQDVLREPGELRARYEVRRGKPVAANSLCSLPPCTCEDQLTCARVQRCGPGACLGLLQAGFGCGSARGKPSRALSPLSEPSLY